MVNIGVSPANRTIFSKIFGEDGLIIFPIEEWGFATIDVASSDSEFPEFLFSPVKLEPTDLGQGLKLLAIKI